MPERRKLLLVPAAVTAAALLALGGVTLASSNESSSEPTTPPGQAGPPRPSAVPPAVSARLGVLRGPRSSGDAFPPQAASTPQNLAFIGGNDALSRRVHGPGPARWIVPGATGLCLTQQTATNFGTACGATDGVQAGRFVLVSDGTGNGGLMTVSGVVPDGVTHVTVRDGAGSPHDASVYDNSYSIAIPSGAASVSWIAADGSKGGLDIPAVDESASP